MKLFIVAASALAVLGASSAMAAQQTSQAANTDLSSLANKTPEQVAAAKVLVRRSIGQPVVHPELIKPGDNPTPQVQVPAGGSAVVTVEIK